MSTTLNPVVSATARTAVMHHNSELIVTQNVITNPADSGQVYKITSVIVSSDKDLIYPPDGLFSDSPRVYWGDGLLGLFSRVRIRPKTTLVLVTSEKPEYVEPGFSYTVRTTAADLYSFICYEVIG